MFYIFYYLYKKLGLDKNSFLNKIIKVLTSNKVYSFLFYIYEKDKSLRIKQYQLFTSTKIGYFIYASIYTRSARFLGCICMLLMVTFHPTMLLLLSVHKDSVIINFLASIFFAKLFIVLGLLGFCINNLYYILFAILNIIYSPQLIQNSPVNVTNCVILVSRTCLSASLVFVSGAFIPGIDYSFQTIGLVPPLKSFYAEAQKNITGGYITPEMGGLPSANLYKLNGNEFPGAGMVQHLQNKTLKVETKLHHDFLKQESLKKI